MNLKTRKCTPAFLLVLICLGSYLIPYVAAAGCHYELDKPYYHPGDTAYFLAEVSNNQPTYVDIKQATLNITGIGVFTWDSSTVNSSDLHSASLIEMPLFDASGNVYEHVVGCRIEKGGSAVFHIYFTIPADAPRTDYSYSFYMPIVTDIPVQIYGVISVYPQGESPPPDSSSTFFLVGLLLILVFSLTYLILRWKKAKASKYAKIGVILSAVFVLITMWRIIAFALFLSFIFLPFWPLIFIVAVAFLWRRRKRKMKKDLLLAKPVQSRKIGKNLKIKKPFNCRAIVSEHKKCYLPTISLLLCAF